MEKHERLFQLLQNIKNERLNNNESIMNELIAENARYRLCELSPFSDIKTNLI